MIISHRISKGKNILYEVNSKEELIKFLNESLKPKNLWLNVGDELNFQFQPIYESAETITKKQWYNKWSKFLKPYSNTRHEIYWTIRGYSQEVAKRKISEIAKRAGDSFSVKIKENPQNYKSYNPTQIEYWLKKGYNEDEAKALVSERQSTFSLEKCIIKWGLAEGTKRFNDRNEKWINSLNKTLNVTWTNTDKDCRSIKYYRFSKEPLIELAKAYVKFNFISEEVKDIYIKIIDSNINSHQSLLTFIKELNVNEAILLSNLNPLQEYLNLNKNNILEYWNGFNEIEYKKTKWGNLYYHNGFYFQSTGEWLIGTFLIKNKIEFKMHKRYPIKDNIFFYDFYLPRYDLYIEYCGRDLKSYMLKQNLLKNTFDNIFWESNIDSIFKKILSMINSEKIS